MFGWLFGSNRGLNVEEKFLKLKSDAKKVK